ncbi:Ig-like domain-containing protein [Planctomycetota bacterium]
MRWLIEQVDADSVTAIHFTGSPENDRLVNLTDLPLIASGEAGDDLIIGGKNNDHLEGNAGNDILIGGMGADSLFGDDSSSSHSSAGSGRRGQTGGVDLLIQCDTVYQSDEQLNTLIAIWTDPAKLYSDKVNQLIYGSSGIHLSFEANSLIDDDVPDQLTGGGETDLFISSYLDTISDLETNTEQDLKPWFLTPAGEKNLISHNWQSQLSYGGSSVSAARISSTFVEGLPSTSALHIQNKADTSPSSNDLQFTIYSNLTPSKDQLVYLSFFFRATPANPDSSVSLRVRWQTESGQYLIGQEWPKARSEWQQFRRAAMMPSSEKIKLNVAFGGPDHTIDFAGLELVSYASNQYTLGALTQPQSYQYPDQVMQPVTLLPVTSNDKDTDGDHLEVTTILKQPAHGTASIDADGHLLYRKTDLDYFGYDAMQYGMSDQHGNANWANVKLVSKHDLTDGTWYVGDDPTMETAFRKLALPLSDQYNSPYGSWKMIRATGGEFASLVQNDPSKESYWLVFAKMNADGSKGFPAGWIWNFADELPGGNWGYAGIALHSHDANWKGFHHSEVKTWNFHLDVSNYMLGFNRAILINSYWYSLPGGVNDPASEKTLDLGLFFTGRDMFSFGPEYIEYEIDGRTVYLNPAIKRYYIIVDDFHHFVEDIDMAPYIRHIYDIGLQTKTTYWWGGAFDMELKHRTGSNPEDKTTGEVMVNNFHFMVHLDIPAQTPITNRVYARNSGIHTFSLSKVFDRRGSDQRIWNAQSKIYQDIPAKLTYSLTANSDPNLVTTSLRGNSNLSITPRPNVTGTATITVRGTDYFNRWYDAESFTVTITDDTSNLTNDPQSVSY